MENNPIDTDAFKHELQFADFNSNWYEICEPIGFDGAEFIIEQNSGRYSRDVVKFAVDKLKFVDANGGLATTTQQINPQGDYSEFKDYALQWLLYAIKLKGFEAKVYYKLSANGTTLRIFQFDFTEEPLTDGKTYVECKLIDNGTVMSVKRTFESKFNAFSDKDWFGNTITPINTFNYLKRAIKSTKKSKWESTTNTTFNTVFPAFFNPIQSLVLTDVENSVTFFQPYTGGTDPFFDFPILKLKRTNTNLAFKVNFSFNNSIDPNFADGLQFYIQVGTDSLNIRDQVITQIPYVEDTDTTFTAIIPIPVGYIGETVSVYFSQALAQVTFYPSSIELTTTSQSVDTVMKAFRWIDLINQASKFKGNLPINASLFENGGVHYNNAIFNKRMMTSRTDYFYITPKDVFESVQEVNCDYEIDESGIFVDHQTQYYKNQEIGAFTEIPSADYSQPENKRAQVNKGTYAYSVFEQDRTTTGTSAGVHTEMELRILNESVENTFDRKIKFSRDPLASQKAIDLEVSEPTTATEDDNNYYIEDFISLAPNSFGIIDAVLLINISDTKLEMLNTNSNGDDSVKPFVWTSIGVAVGSGIFVTIGANTGGYTVTAIETNKITLAPTPGILTSPFIGNTFVRLKYFYTNVAFQTRTNQGFSLIENISDTFSNLFYTIKRNLQNYFSEHLAMIMYYAQKDIIVAKPPINENCTTQLTTETEPVIENAPITFDSLPNPLITPKMYNGVMAADYNDVVNYLNAYKVIRGFIRVVTADNEVKRVFSQDFKYNLSSRELNVKGEVQFETVNLTLTGTKSELFVNGAPYNFNDNYSWWKLSNEYLRLYDENSRPITNEYHFNLVILNGATFETREELESALVNLS